MIASKIVLQKFILKTITDNLNSNNNKKLSKNIPFFFFAISPMFYFLFLKPPKKT